MLSEFNQIVRKIGTPLNIINLVVGLLSGIAHVYLPIPSLTGLILGILMAVSGSATMAISYYYTSKNSQIHNTGAQQKKELILKDTPASKRFLVFALPMLLLNTASSFFGMYTGTSLLFTALALPMITPAVALTITVALSTILAAGTLINSWLQTHYIWESLKEPVKTKSKNQKESKVIHCDAATQTEDFTVQPKVSLDKILLPRHVPLWSLFGLPNRLTVNPIKKIEDAGLIRRI